MPHAPSPASTPDPRTPVHPRRRAMRWLGLLAAAPLARLAVAQTSGPDHRPGSGGVATRASTGSPGRSIDDSAPDEVGGAGAAVDGDYPLAPGDLVRIQVYQQPDLTLETRLSERGGITYPLLGPLALGGLSLRQAERRIAQGLRDGGFLRAPQVTVHLVQAQGHQVSVLGQVVRPGRFVLDGPQVRASTILAAAGGVTAQGEERVIVSGVRHGQRFRQVIDLQALFTGAAADQDVVLMGGDTLFVPRAPVFYIYGEAQRPGPYRVEREMTVMQALAAGGGPTARGSARRLRLHRQGPNGQTVESTPQLTDRVQPNDVLYVRESLF